MSTITIEGSNLGSVLIDILMADGIEPGSDVSYQLCKTLYLYHPLGAKMAEEPIRLAQSQQREISVPDSPEDRVREAFLNEWKALGADKHIFNVMRTSRIYGVASIVYGAEGVPTDRPIAPTSLPDLALYFNVLDPLNTSGSLVLNQDPNSPDFQKHTAITVAGQAYHRSRACVMLNEEPIYISYTTSGFGYVGRSVYQRALFPLKSFVQSMLTDDLVTKKAGVFIAKMKPAGSITDRLMQGMAGIKRQLLKEAKTSNVLSIGIDEDIETLNMMNTDNAMTVARKNILENVAVAAQMPAKLLNSETFAEGFGEGTEDAKHIARYVEREREGMQPLYDFFDKIVQYRAWNPEFYKTIQADYPEYRDVPYTKAFFDWVNSFAAAWPSLLIEPESERIKVDDTKLKAIISMLEVLMPEMDPDNKGALVQWAADNFNDLKLLFQNPLSLDIDALRNYVPPTPPAAFGQPAVDDLGKAA